MRLKGRVDELLKKEKRSASWLSEEMDMTPDGLRLSLVNESIKYSSLVRLSEILGVKVSVLFGEVDSEVIKHDEVASIPRNDTETSSAQAAIIKLLKEQIRDKQLIIDLLRKERKGGGE